jgi:hypothetical protein
MSTEDSVDPIKPRSIGGADDYSDSPSSVYLSFFWPFFDISPPFSDSFQHFSRSSTRLNVTSLLS